MAVITDVMARIRETVRGSSRYRWGVVPVASLPGGGGVSPPFAISDTTGLQAGLDGKAPTEHTQAISTVTGLEEVLEEIEPLAIRRADLTLNDAAIKAWPTGDGTVQIVAAPAAGTLLRIVDVLAIAHIVDIYLQGVFEVEQLSLRIGFPPILNVSGATKPTYLTVAAGSDKLAVPTIDPSTDLVEFDLSDVVVQPIVAWNDFVGDAFTGGNAANYIKIIVFYAEIDLT